MAARLGWNIQNIPDGMTFFAAQDTDESHYEPGNAGGVADIITGLFSLQGGINRDGGGGAAVWTPTWLPVAADPIPDLTFFGAANQFFRCTGGVSGPPINLYNGELQMRATLGGTPLPGYLRLVVTSDPDYGSAAWDFVSDAPTCDFVGVPLAGNAPLDVDFTDLSNTSGALLDEWLIDETVGVPNTLVSLNGTEVEVFENNSTGVVADPSNFGGNVLQKDGGVPVEGFGFIIPPNPITAGLLRFKMAVQDDFVAGGSDAAAFVVNRFSDGAFNLILAVSDPGGAPLPFPQLRFRYPGGDPLDEPVIWTFEDELARDIQVMIGPTAIVFKVDDVQTGSISRAAIGFSASFAMNMNVGQGGSDFHAGHVYWLKDIEARTLGVPVDEWLWDFGDGNTAVVQNPSNAYANAGRYTVGLTINGGEASEVKVDYVAVTEPPVVDFEPTPDSGTAPLDVQFTDTTTPGEDPDGGAIVPDAWHWDFGDGEESTEQNPSHTYNAPGTYDVVFNASFDGDPLSPTVTKPIVVSQPAIIGEFMNVLPISRLIRVSANLTPAGAQAQNLSNLLILGSSPVIDTVQRKRDYASLEEVAADFGTSAPEYLAALLWFEQVPQPTTLSIGRMTTSAASGGLRGAPRSAAQQAIAAWNAVTNGSFTYTKDGGAPANITGLNFSAAANLNAVAAIIQGALPGITVQWNSVYARFEFTSTTTGITSAVGFLTPVGSGTDISSMVGGRSTDSGSYVFTGQAAETPIEAVQSFEIAYGRQWYALVVIGAVNADHLQIAAFLEGTNTKHLYGVTTLEGGVLVSTDTTNIAYQLKQLAYKKTMVQYASANPYAVVSALARILTTDYRGQNTTITLMYKQEPGIVPENLSTNQMNAVQGFNCNVFALFDNDTAIILYGVTASGIFIDTVIGTDAMVLDIQSDLWNLLYTSTTKLPQTNQGAHLMVTTCENRLAQYVANGFLAPGIWNATGFGSLKTGDYVAKGFYVFAPNVDSQPQADRAARKSVPIQIAAKLAGAVHEISVGITVNQ